MPSYHCKQPSCPNILKQYGYCNEHSHLATAIHNESVARYDKSKRDKNAARFYASDVWAATRMAKLAEQPLCEHCKIQVATEVHHDEPVRSNWDRRLDMSNLIAICGGCHKRLEAARYRSRVFDNF